jgi:hypothetical protein
LFIEISAEWSPILPPEKHVPSVVVIKSGYFSDIERISQGFAPKDMENPTEFFSGFVTELRGETNDMGRKYGDVVAQLTRSDGESFSVTITLPEQEHQEAIKSYEGNLPVYLSGKLGHDSGRKRNIRDVNFFKLCKGNEQ